MPSWASVLAQIPSCPQVPGEQGSRTIALGALASRITPSYSALYNPVNHGYKFCQPLNPVPAAVLWLRRRERLREASKPYSQSSMHCLQYDTKATKEGDSVPHFLTGDAFGAWVMAHGFSTHVTALSRKTFVCQIKIWLRGKKKRRPRVARVVTQKDSSYLWMITKASSKFLISALWFTYGSAKGPKQHL